MPFITYKGKASFQMVLTVTVNKISVEDLCDTHLKSEVGCTSAIVSLCCGIIQLYLVLRYSVLRVSKIICYMWLECSVVGITP